MEKGWKQEFARDTLALGSIVFYFLVFLRAVVGKFTPFIYNLIITFVVIILLSQIIKNSNLHIARGFVLMVLTSGFYKQTLFTLFAALVFVLMMMSAWYLKDKVNNILKGLFIGVVSTAVGYYLSQLLIM